jgi:hypothetical protein
MAREFQKNIFILFGILVNSLLYKMAEMIKTYAYEQKITTINSNGMHECMLISTSKCTYSQLHIYIYMYIWY